MFWSDLGDPDGSSARIERAPMDGSSHSPLIRGLGAPTGLALDPAAAAIYWCDEKLGTRLASVSGALLPRQVMLFSSVKHMSVFLNAHYGVLCFVVILLTYFLLEPKS